MPLMRVRNIGTKGVIKDLPAFELPPEAWSDARNVRFAANRIEKSGGYFPVLTEGMPEVNPPLAVLYRNNTLDQIYATRDSIFKINGTTHENISKLEPNPNYKPPTIPDPGHTGEGDAPQIPNPDYDPSIPEKLSVKYDAAPDSTWYYTTLSNAIIMNTPRGVPQGLAPHMHQFEDLPGWGKPTKDSPVVPWTCGRIRAFRNYLIALDMVESGVKLPQRVRWSNIAYVNALPPDWIENEKSKDGGFNDLTDANGRIIDGVPLRDSFVIYTDKETYLMDYVGGIFIFQWRKLFSDSGILAPECAVEFEGKHFVIAQDDIFVHNGSSRQPIASARIKKWLIDEISSTNPAATKVFAYSPAKEIWVTYVGPGRRNDLDSDTAWQCNKCAVWNWEWDTWTFFDLPLSYDVNMAPPPQLDVLNWEDFSTDPEDQWDSEKWTRQQWSDIGKDFVNNVPYIASPDKCLYTVDIGYDQITYRPQTRDVQVRPVVAELHRTHFDMDEMVESTRLHKFVKTITPQFRGQGQIYVHVGGSYNPTEEPTWDNFQIFDVEEDVKVDAFSNNRYPAVKFIDHSRGEWSMLAYDIDFVVEGNR